MSKNRFPFYFFLVVFVNSVFAISNYIINPYFVDYLVSNEIQYEITGLIAGMLSWVSLINRPFTGSVCDRFNKKNLMLLSYFLVCICLFAYPNISSKYLIIIIRILHGFAFSLCGTITISFASDFIPENRMGEGIGYVSFSSAIGSMIGPQIGSLIYERFDINAFFYFDALLMFICIAIIIYIKYPKNIVNKTSDTKGINFNGLFVKELCIFSFLIMLFSVGDGIISFYLKDMGSVRNIKNITLFFTVYSIVMICVKRFSGTVQDRKGLSYILMPSFVLSSISMIILANAYSLVPVIISAVLKAFGFGGGIPGIQAECITRVDDKKRGAAISMSLIGQDIGNAIGPMFAGYVIPKLGYANMYYIYSLLLLLGLIVYVTYRKMLHK